MRKPLSYSSYVIPFFIPIFVKVKLVPYKFFEHKAIKEERERCTLPYVCSTVCHVYVSWSAMQKFKRYMSLEDDASPGQAQHVITVKLLLGNNKWFHTSLSETTRIPKKLVCSRLHINCWRNEQFKN